ncbi:cytochrome C oxidase subunit IV family protein [Nocardia wallacei]|uniref:cytochrome C oxidase subunit IV family protein n=1 Tax=Nocardia wallacei TaxID=480035 RepID=UPI002455700A|nr:cytochrome C oxidase subunit IV family protein [Nocardia wallacei]
MDGGSGATASTQTRRADRNAVYAWSLLLAITVVSVIFGRYARGWDYEPVVVVACAGLKFWIIAFKFMNSRGSAHWLRVALDVYVVLLVIALTVPYFV